MSYAIHWFRRDLRVAGNPALHWAWREHSGRVVGLFCFDSSFLSRPDFSANRFAFFLNTLKALQAELRAIGSDLLVLDVGPEDAFGKVLGALLPAGALPKHICFNRDYEPYARRRDAAMTHYFEKSLGVAVHTERDHVLIEPHEITKDRNAGSYYQVYSPFAKRWFEKLASSEVQSRIDGQMSGLSYLEQGDKGELPRDLFRLTWHDVLKDMREFPDKLEEYREKNHMLVTVPVPEAGSSAALRRLRQFASQGLNTYGERRDIPAVDGTSQLSMYFKNGSLTPAQVIAYLGLKNLSLKTKESRTIFLKEIVWREFYYHILYHCPRVEHEAFLEKYKRLHWDENEERFKAWKEGRTGYPIVDAGMRQLAASGWMHNRVRMIVASFLTKDLHLSWQWGERYFMQQLLDGDLAPNNGGWQWAASTGCDAQPYFRVFNPTLQGQKFDPDGEFVKRYIPELMKVPSECIHEPHTWGGALDYPAPIVEHSAEKERALRMYTDG